MFLHNIVQLRDLLFKINFELNVFSVIVQCKVETILHFYQIFHMPYVERSKERVKLTLVL